MARYVSAFTPDEEVGNGTAHFDVEQFGAYCAYTMDGETLGELQVETFSADSINVTFHGFNTHPGFAKGKMVNAIKVAAEFIGRLPREACHRRPRRATTALCIPT